MSEQIVTIVTGASRGIGRAISVRLADEGHTLALFGRNTKMLQETAALCKNKNVNVVIFSGNVADREFVIDAVNQILERFGKIDNLINNAGEAVLKLFTETSLEEFKTQIDANLFGVFNFCKAVIDNMIERNAGNIINISSLAGKILLFTELHILQQNMRLWVLQNH